MDKNQQPQSDNKASPESAPPKNISLPPPETASAPPMQTKERQKVSSDTTDVLGIVSIIMPFIGLPPVGLILGIVGVKKAKNEGYSPTLSTIGLILNAVLTALAIIAIIFVFAIFYAWN